MHAQALHVVQVQQVQAVGTKLVKGQQQPTTRSHPYQSLLQQYLSHFLPRGGHHSVTYSSSRGSLRSVGHPSKGELLFSILMEFWLTDGEDPALRKPKQDRPLPALPYEPPTDDLLEAMQVCPDCLSAVHNASLQHVSLLRTQEQLFAMKVHIIPTQ